MSNGNMSTGLKIILGLIMFAIGAAVRTQGDGFMATQETELERIMLTKQSMATKQR